MSNPRFEHLMRGLLVVIGLALLILQIGAAFQRVDEPAAIYRIVPLAAGL